MAFIHELLNLQNKKIILASQSPRRQELLSTAGLSFEVIPAEVNENPTSYDDEIDFVRKSSQIKGNWVWERCSADLLISADTIVVKEKTIYGKPKDVTDAIRTLELLSDDKHQVITAFYLRSAHETIIDHDITDVTFYPLSPAEIAAYVATGEPMDKAGAYGIQGYGASLIEKIDGSYFNVMGFPIARVYQRLKNMKI